MKLIVRTPVSQRRVMIDGADGLDGAVKDAFKVEEYELFGDPERTRALDRGALTDGQIIYMSYAMKEPEVYRPKPKCNHSPEAVCPECATLDPFDRRRSDGVKVKYLSYGSYRQMLKNNNKAEDDFDYAIVRCEDHPKNVRCSKCIEKVVTLVPQVFRPIDYVEFDNKVCVEKFIGRWRTSGRQHIGLLVGQIKDHPATPLGRRAVVSGIWEIEQENFPDGAVLQCLPRRFLCDDLEIVGLIYTDLWTRDGAPFSYKSSLGISVSAVELGFFYEVQAAVSKEKKKRDGDRPLEFVHVCVSVDDEKNIAPSCFMLTKQFIALFKIGALVPTTDPSSFSTERDISYLVRNEYNRDVPVRASPLVPVDYFVVNCEIGYRDRPVFPNPAVLEKGSLREIARHFAGDFSFEKCQSFSVLIALCRHLPFGPELISAAVRDDRELFSRVAAREEFATFCRELGKFHVSAWNCKACTFNNQPGADRCEMCLGPR